MRKNQPKSLPTPQEPEVMCKHAFKGKVKQSWCEKTRHQAVCAGCERNIGNEVSRWQEENAGAKTNAQPNSFEPVGQITARVVQDILDKS